MPQVCCLKKAPPLAICIDLVDFEPFGCEKQDLPCFTPSDCPAGLTCCFGRNDFTVTCRPTLLCPGDGVDTFIACGTSEDCPISQPSCNNIGTGPTGQPFNICGSLTGL